MNEKHNTNDLNVSRNVTEKNRANTVQWAMFKNNWNKLLNPLKRLEQRGGYR